MKSCFSILLLGLVFSFTGCAQGNKLNEDLALKYLIKVPANKSGNTPVVILLHGYGSDEKDLFELAKFFPANFMVIAARAPYKLPDRQGFQWYEMIEVDGHHAGKKENLDHSRDLIIKFIGQVVNKYKTDPKQVYVAGFSQGAMMSFIVGLSAPEKMKGIAPLSGMIMASVKPEIKNNADLKRLKIFIAHGTADIRVPFEDDKASYDYLLSLGLKPEFHQYEGVGHQITKEEIDELMLWLTK
jgi:phospholipase/carboxylesterase